MTLQLDSRANQATPATFAGMFFIALGTLTYELLLTRIFSVTMWYHFAFVAISMAMFGMTAGALLVFLAPRLFPAGAVKQRLALASVVCAVLMVFCFLVELSIPFLIHPSIVGIFAIAFTYSVGTLPFIASGVAVCLALTQFPRRGSRLYAGDPIGAALACAALVYLLRVTDGPTGVIAAATVAALAGVCFAFDAGATHLRRIAVGIAVLLAGVTAAHTALVQ